MQITLPNNKGNSGGAGGAAAVYGGHAGKMYNSKKNNFAMGALEIMSTRNAPRSLDKYAIEAAHQHGHHRHQIGGANQHDQHNGGQLDRISQ